MSVRRCTRSDEDEVAILCSKGQARSNTTGDIADFLRAAFWDDELLGTIMHPHRDRYPDDFIGYFRRRFHKSLDNPAHCVLVTTSRDDQGHEIVTGFADWIRERGGQDDSLAATTDMAASQNRAADPTQADIFERAGPFSKHFWAGDRAETWLLDLLAVHPDHQRNGYGKRLVSEGLELATKDHVCASVIASLSGDGLYRSCGFTPVGWVTEGEGNPLYGLPGGRILFRDHR